jgi:tetratricopeptide (TPR) repeat protein
MTAPPATFGSLATPETPWLGLRSFTEDAQMFFFGRRDELDDLYERILDKPLTVLFGQSGLGKSSLLQAALVPRLRSTGFLPILIRFDHEADAPGLEHQMLDCLRVALECAGFAGQAADVRAALAQSSGAQDLCAFLWLIFHDPAHQFIPHSGLSADGCPRPVFLIDQFEEIYTVGERRERRSVCSAFRETLAALVENRPPASLRTILEEDDELAERLDYKAPHVRVLLSLREDFLHLLERLRRTMPSIMENRLELRMLNGPQAFHAVVRPGQLRSGMPAIIPDKVGEAIVRFVAGANDEASLDEIDAVPPLLSLLCAELNAQRIDAGHAQITQAQFDGHGTDILASFYLRSFDPATYGVALDGVPDAIGALDDVRCLIEDRLLSPDGFRQSVAFDTMTRDVTRRTAPEASKVVLDALVERRLLTVEERGGVRRLELAHDVLTRIVKASRDDRHEIEAVSKAKLEQTRAEAETARIRKDRNRLRLLATIAWCLVFVALTSAFVAWRSFEKSKKAVEDALNAEKKAKADFDATWNGLTNLYEKYASETLEDTPGISSKQALDLKSKLRGHLFEQLEDLHRSRPEHRPTIDYLARLRLDEGREATLAGKYPNAKESLDEAQRWSEALPTETASEAEARADILLEQACAFSADGDSKGAAEIATRSLPEIRRLASTWRERSWRLKYAVIRLEALKLLAETNNRAESIRLADQLSSVISESGRHFDPVIWQFNIKANAYRRDGGFDRSAGAYLSIRDLTVSFREHLVLGKPYKRVQFEDAVGRFHELLKFLQKQFQEHKNKIAPREFNAFLNRIEISPDVRDVRLTKSTLPDEPLPQSSIGQNSIASAKSERTLTVEELASMLTSSRFPAAFTESDEKVVMDERRALLYELENTMKAIETHLPNSTIVYGARGDLLKLQEMSMAEGINTRSSDELRTATQKHRMVASALGVGSSVADSLAPAFKSYTDDNATQVSRALARTALETAEEDFFALDLSGADTVLQNDDIRSATEILQELDDDSVASLYNRMVDRYLSLYTQASRDSKVIFLDTTVRLSDVRVQKWYAAKRHDKVVEFWNNHYAGLPIRKLSSGDKEAFIRQQTVCALSHVQTGRFEIAQHLLDDTFALCEKIVAERPWHYYVRAATIDLCFKAANNLRDRADAIAPQAWLRRGWAVKKDLHGSQIDLSRYRELPFPGDLPQGVSASDASFFSRFESTGRRANGNAKKFTIQADSNRKRFPISVDVIAGTKGYARLLDQFRCLNEMRGLTVVTEIRESCERIEKMANDEKRDFLDLCSKELPGAVLDVAETNMRIQRARSREQGRKGTAPDDNADREQALSTAYLIACRSAIACSDWKKLDDYAREWHARDSNNASAQSSLAIALFVQSRVAEALAIYRKSWDGPNANGRFRKVVSADIQSIADFQGMAATLLRLYLTAQENNVAFPLQIKQAFKDQIKTQESLNEATRKVIESESAFQKVKSDSNRRLLAEAYSTLARCELYLKRWLAAEESARKSVELDKSSVPVGYASLATARMFQGKFEQALESIQKWSTDPAGKAVGDAILADFLALEQIGITHPDVGRIRTVLENRAKTSPSNGDAGKAHNRL